MNASSGCPECSALRAELAAARAAIVLMRREAVAALLDRDAAEQACANAHLGGLDG